MEEGMVVTDGRIRSVDEAVVSDEAVVARADCARMMPRIITSITRIRCFLSRWRSLNGTSGQ
jgi:hypothetical protein